MTFPVQRSFTLSEAAKILNVSRTYAFNLLKEGKLMQAHSPTGRILVGAQSVEDYRKYMQVHAKEAMEKLAHFSEVNRLYDTYLKREK
jgi:hypothetical protein